MADKKTAGRDFGMISSKFDAVQRNQIWTEILENEKKSYRPFTSWKVNAEKIAITAPKPHDFDPNEAYRLVDEKKSRNEGIADADRGKPKRVVPLAMSEDYGFFALEAKKEKRWLFPKSSCEETRYADSYFEMARVSPYSSAARREVKKN